MDKQVEIIAAIKAKKGLETLDDDFVKQKTQKIFSSNNRIKKKFDDSRDFAQFSRSSEYDDLLKAVRKELRAVYGVFQKENRSPSLEKLRTTKKSEAIREILASHQSTSERLPYYDEIATELSKRIPTPKTVIDLGCGMNPLAYDTFSRFGWKSKLIASDISQNDMDFLDDCFKILKIPGKTIKLDLTTQYEQLSSLKGDVTLLLKLLDSLEEAKRHISYKIFENITTPIIVVSFPTKSLGGKKSISSAGRTWFERLLKRKELAWETFSVPNELFYVIKRNST